MQKYIVSVLLSLGVLLATYSCQDKKSESEFTIKGTLKNVDSPYFYIAIESADSVIVDTIMIDRKGKFSYKGNAESLAMASLYFNQKAWSTSIFINKGWEIELKGDINKPDLIAVKGGNINNDLSSFKESNKNLFQSKSDLLKHLKEDTVAENVKDHNIELMNINFELTKKAKTYIENNPTKIASLVLIQDFYKKNSSIEALDEQLALMKGETLDYPLYKELNKYSQKAKKSQVGAIAPNLTLTKGKSEVSLEKFRGKYVLLSFTDENCDAHKKEFPIAQDVYKSLKKKNVEFLSIIIDDLIENKPTDSISWQVFYEKKGWASEAINLYNITEIPYNILLSPDGHILERGLSISLLPKKIEELQKKK